MLAVDTLEIVSTTAISVAVSTVVGVGVYKLGHWLVESVTTSFSVKVVEVMAPEMAHQSTKVTTALDELRITNTSQHYDTAARLLAVETRQTDVEHRLAAVESKLNIRPPETRTRKED